MKFRVTKDDNNITLPDGAIPSKFKRYVHKKGKKRGTLNVLPPEAKVVAAITKALAMQGMKDRNNYYISGDSVHCPDINAIGKDGKMSVAARGRFKMGVVQGEDISFRMMSFNIKFRDGEDEFGLRDIVIEDAIMNVLPKGTPLHS